MKYLSIIIILIMVGFSSCEKDKKSISQPTKSSMGEVHLESVIIDVKKSKENMAKIKAFKDMLKSDSKDVTYLTESEAQWILDAAANYDYVSISEAYPQFDVDTFTYLIPVDGNGILSADLATVYEAISEDVEGINSSLEHGENVEIQGITLSLNNNAGVQNMVQANLLVNLGFYPNVTSFSTANNDYWYWGKELGRINGQDQGQDATTQITYAANQAIINFLNPGNYTFSDNEALTVHWDDQGAAFNNSYGSRLWHKDNVPLTPEPYLTPAEMNEFLNHALYIAQYYKPNGKMIRFISMSYGELKTYSSNGVQYYDKYHTITISYGTPNI